MNCELCQSQLSEALDHSGTLTDPAVEQHLAGCLGCQAFRNAWLMLDGQLTQGATSSALPVDFKATLLARLPERPLRLLPAEIAEMRQRVEQDYQQALVTLQRRHLFLDVATLLRLGTVASAIIVVVVLLNLLVRTLPDIVPLLVHFFETVGNAVVLSLAIGFSALLFAVNRVWHPLRRWLPSW